MGNHPTRGGGGRILPGFSQLRGWEIVFVRGGGGQKEQNLKFPPNLGQNNESYRGGWTFKKRRKIPTF